MSEPLLVARGVCKSYHMGSEVIPVLKDLELSIQPGEAVAVVGASGVGKSTLLHVLGLLDAPDAGEIVCSGTELSSLPPDLRAGWRNRIFGFVFQFYHLIPELTALENTLLPAMMHARGGTDGRDLRERARAILTELGLGDRLRHRPGQLSGGERQRVAIARALMNDPAVVLCDEPTGNLDPATSVGVQEALWNLKQRRGQAMVLVTHDESLAARADRVLRMEGGRLVEVDRKESGERSPEQVPEPVRAVAVDRVPMAEALLSVEGRLGRAAYWLRGLVPTLALGAAAWLGYSLAGGESAGLLAALALFTAYLVLLWPALATAVKRCHDRNRSGRFLFLLVGPGFLLLAHAFFMLSLELPTGYWLLGILPALPALWVLTEIWVLPGTAGANRYGADPRRPIYGYRPG